MSWKRFSQENPRDGQTVLVMTLGDGSDVACRFTYWLATFYAQTELHPFGRLVTVENKRELEPFDFSPTGIVATHWMPLPDSPNGSKIDFK